MGFSLEKSAIAVCAHGLHDPNVDVCIEVIHECVAANVGIIRKTIQIMIEQLLAQRGGQVCLCIVQERSDVVLERAAPPALVVHKKWVAVAKHDVAGLKI